MSQDGRSTLVAHGLVGCVPILMSPTGCREHATQEKTGALAIHVGVRGVGSNEVRRTFDSRPLPTCPHGNHDGELLRRFLILPVPPAATNATTSEPVNGCCRTPALTTDPGHFHL